MIIPRSASARRDDKDSYGDTPSFVRNVMGSSAGAGSGEFHVYRHLRRKEYARQKQIQQKSVQVNCKHKSYSFEVFIHFIKRKNILQEELDDAFQKKLEENRLKSEAKTAKKRAKRMKRKHRVKNKKPNNPTSSDSQANDSDSDEAESDNEGEKLSTENEEKTMETQPKKAVEEKEESKSDQQTESGNDKDQSDE